MVVKLQIKPLTDIIQPLINIVKYSDLGAKIVPIDKCTKLLNFR